jgi:hypothetical protein
MNDKSHRRSFTSSPCTWIVVFLRILVLSLSLVPNELSNLLKNRGLQSILIDPVQTLDQVREGIAIRMLAGGSFADAYAAKTIHLPPLMLLLMETFVKKFPTTLIQNVLLGLFLLCIDFYVAKCLEQLGDALDDNAWETALQPKIPNVLKAPLAHVFDTRSFKQATARMDEQSQLKLNVTDVPRVVAQLYFYSPIVGLSATLGSFQNVQVLFVVLALRNAFHKDGSVVPSAFCLTVASYLNVHNLVFFIPLVLLLRNKTNPTIAFAILFTAWLQALSILVIGSDQYASIFVSTHLHTYQLLRLAPSLSTLWYLSMLLFDRFRLYFTFLLGGAPYLLLLPLTIRLYRYPMVMVRKVL